MKKPTQPEASPEGSQHFAEMHMREAEEAESTRPSPEKPPARLEDVAREIAELANKTVEDLDEESPLFDFREGDVMKILRKHGYGTPPDLVQHGVGPKWSVSDGGYQINWDGKCALVIGDFCPLRPQEIIEILAHASLQKGEEG